MENNINTTSNTVSRAEYDALKQELAETRAQNEWLMEQLKLSKKKLYGQSSEKIQEGVMDQLSLTFNEAERMDAASYEPETKVKAHSRKRRSGSVNDITAKELPVERIEHRLSDEERKWRLWKCQRRTEADSLPRCV